MHELELPLVIAWLVDWVITGGHDGVGDGVPLVAVGVGLAQAPSATLSVSTRQPVELTLLSDAIRKRSLIVRPATFGPRFATELV